MKTRAYYVSNSSSSSFVIIGRKIGNLFHEDVKLEKGRQYYVIGTCFEDGYDVISLNDEMAEWLKEHYSKNDRERIREIDGNVIEADFSSYEPDGEKLPAIPEGRKIWSFTADQHSSYDINDASENYPPKE